MKSVSWQLPVSMHFEAQIINPYLSSYPGYFQEPNWKSMGLPEIFRVTWQVCLLYACTYQPPASEQAVVWQRWRSPSWSSRLASCCPQFPCCIVCSACCDWARLWRPYRTARREPRPLYFCLHIARRWYPQHERRFVYHPPHQRSRDEKDLQCIPGNIHTHTQAFSWSPTDFQLNSRKYPW